jgi:hypothetical protein
MGNDQCEVPRSFGGPPCEALFVETALCSEIGEELSEGMSGVLLYIKEDQVDWVFENEDIGSRSSAFKGMAKEGDRVFVASKSEGELAVVGEIPVSKVYEAANHPRGWEFRISANRGTSVRYREPVSLSRVRGELSILKGASEIWRQIRYPRWLTPEDSELISRLGHGPQ